MAEQAAVDATSGLGGATSNAFKLLFALAAVIATGVTYLAVTENTPQEAGQPSLFWLLIANLVIILGLAFVLGTRVIRLIQENSETHGGARLRLRIMFLFSLAAAIPTVIVAGFLAVVINRSVENWFSEPVKGILESARAAGAATQDELSAAVDNDLQAVVSDLQTCEACRTDRATFLAAAKTLAEYRNFPQLTVLNSDRRVVFSLPANQPAPPSDSLWRNRSGLKPYRSIDEQAVRGIMQLPGFEGLFVHVVRPVPPAIGARLRQTSEHLVSIRQADARSGQLAVVLTLSYVEAALLMLLGTAWLGMTAAERITDPVGALAGAARAVRDGDLSVRLLKPGVRDEIADLADAFNEMTDRLSRQTQALDRARIDAESRSAFIEAVLAGVEAGVIRIDANLKVTIANASAQTLLGFVQRPGEATDFGEIAPEFVTAARRSLETGQALDAASKRSTEGDVMHFQIRVAPEEGSGGAVITFHDTTRLVLGQRQAAWRDVARRIAHEIRNPLTPIQLSAERLRRRFTSQISTDRETFERCTETITRQVADLGRMVEEFSGFARMPKPTFGSFDLSSVVEAVAFAQRMATPGIVVTVTTPAPIQMLGDERMLAQAITNVVKNAAEAVERQLDAGEARTGSVALEVQQEEDEVHVIVRDNGPGFPVQDRDRVLEPYVTTRKNGVGLGLAIVSRIVEDHGGRISLGDNEHAATGARVDICLPVQPRLSEDLVAYAGEGAA